MIYAHTLCVNSFMEMGDRLKKARIDAGFPSARQAALRKNFGVSTYAAHENGQNQFGPEEARAYARAFKVSAAWLLTGEGAPSNKPKTTHAIGYVGAGAEVVPVDDHAIGDGLEEIEIPPGVPDDAVLVIVRGDSMYPRYFENEMLFYARQDGDIASLVGRECVVKLRDGRMFVKILRRGTGKRNFNLESWNAPLIEDQPIEWAAPVLARVNGRTK